MSPDEPDSGQGEARGGSEKASKATPALIFNGTSVVGALLGVGALSAVLFFSIRGLIFEDEGAYGGLIYLPMVGVAILGGVLVVLGLLQESRRRKRGDAPLFTRDFRLDLRRLTHRNAIFGVLISAVMATWFVLGVGTGTADMVGFTETNEFCGEVCHDVMHPEATAHKISPHANVACVACHVGEGAGSYIQSKLSGLRQLYALATGNVRRPVPTPILDQRPARAICEACHWPSRFVGGRELVRTYFRADEESSKFQLRMVLDIGGAPSDLMGHSNGTGIHYHMTIGHEVQYMARDRQRQDIPWVRIKHPDGTVEVYEDVDAPLTEEERSEIVPRAMDCLDCHNRPAHRFVSPVRSVNNGLLVHRIPRELPFIKREAVRALDTGYDTMEEAMKGIAAHLRDFYTEEYPDLVREQPTYLPHSIGAVQSIYRKSFFPKMRASWAAYPDNLGHRDSTGCFRCHNDSMEAASGETLFIDCQRCHLILAEGEEVDEVKSHTHAIPFWHPEDEDTIEEFTPCTDCHDGGATLYED